MPSDAESSATSVTEQALDQPGELDKRLVEMRGRISDMGYEIDADKATTAMVMGGSDFLLLLGGLAAYDLFSGKASIYQPFGITRDMLQWVAWGGIGIGLAAILHTALRRRRRDRSREIELAALEEEYARLKDRQEALTQEEK